MPTRSHPSVMAIEGRQFRDATAPGGAALIGLLLLLASTAPAQAQTSFSLPRLLNAGAETFQKSCAQGYCHGSEGRAARAPDIRDRSYERDQLFEIIAKGIDGTTMPGFEDVLSQEDRWAVTSYVLSITKRARPSEVCDVCDPAGNRGPYRPAQPAGQDKHDAGRELFSDLTRQVRCSLCHQAAGVGTAIVRDLASAVAAKGIDAARAWMQETHNVARTSLVLNSGETFEGLEASRTVDQIQLWDLRFIPPVLRRFDRDSIQSLGQTEGETRAPHYNDAYSVTELEAILAYLAAVGSN